MPGDASQERLASVCSMSLSDDLFAAEDAYRTAVTALVRQADDVEPLAQVAAHFANMTATVRTATLAAMERVALFDSVAAAGRAAAHAVEPDTGGTGTPRDDLGEAAIHLEHLVHLLEASETMAGHATGHLLRAAGRD